MKKIRHTFILIIFFLSIISQAIAKPSHYVEIFGQKGFLSEHLNSRIPDVMDRLEGFMGNSHYCSEANRAEYDLIENNSPIINIENDEHINTTAGFDQWSEEIIFGEAASRSQQLSSCQKNLFEGLNSNYTEKFNMEEIAWEKFQEIIPFVEGKVVERTTAEDVVANAISASNFREDRLSGTVDHMYKARQDVRRALNLVKADISSALSRVPIGNRYEMKEFLLKLIEDNNTISKAQFLYAYRQGLSKLTNQARRSHRFFEGIKDKETGSYFVNEDLKKSLARAGQVENVVNALGIDDELKHGFMCRSKARYENGPTNLMIVEIPLYFTGVYGLGRATLAAGVKVVRATSTLSRLTANAALWSARAATIGLEAYTYARITDEVRQICFPLEYTAAIKQQSCSFESEVQGAYQEASIAQCLTAAALGFAPIAAIGAFRVAKVVKHPEILVNGLRARKQNFYLGADESVRIGDSSRVRTVLDSNSPNLEQAAKLTDKQRIYVFEEISGTALSRTDAEKLLSAHRRGPGYGSYSKADLRYKAQIVKEVLETQGKTQLEIRSITRSLMRKGILGKGGSGLSDLPAAAIAKIKSIDEISKESPIQKTSINMINDINIDNPRRIVDILKDNPRMDKAMRIAHKRLGQNKQWKEYFEETITAIFREMKNSGDPKLLKLVEEGKISRKAMLDVFEKRFNARNLKISKIPEGSEVLSFAEFKAKLKSGPLLDDAFRHGYLSEHGPYPHLFQLDYVLDDMVRVSDNVKPKDFFDFWAGSDDGLNVWNDIFDLYDESTITLRDTITVTQRYLDKIEVVDDML